MQLHFKELGDARAFSPPLVILHGLFGSLDNWLGVAPRLAQNFHLFLLDLRNHGLSPHSDEMDYPLMAADLAEFLHLRQIASANVLGHSLGGKVAMQFALDFPARAERLVVVDVSPRAYPPEHGAIFKALLALDSNRFRALREIEEALAPEIPDLTVRRFLLKSLKSLRSSSLSSPSYQWKIPLNAIFRNYPKLCQTIASQASFSKPALFLRGGKSHYVSDADAPVIQKLFPAATIETIPRAGHWVHADAPGEFARCVSRILKN